MRRTTANPARALQGPASVTERGQAIPLMAVVVALVVVLLLAATRVGRPLADAAQARTAADAAALAGAAEGRSAASRMAVRNGGRVIDFVALADGVEVRVRVGSAVARARASATVEWLARPGRADDRAAVAIP